MNDTNESIPNKVSLKSSMLEWAAYDMAHWTLTLEFKTTGLILCYQQVAPETYEEFMAAESQGKFYNAEIKSKFDTLVVREGVKPPLKIAGEPVAPGADLAMSACPHGVMMQNGLFVGHCFACNPQVEQPDFSYKGENGIPDSETGHRAVETSDTHAVVPPELCPYIQPCYVHMRDTRHYQRPDGSYVCAECHPEPFSAPVEAPQVIAKAPELLAPLEAPKTAADAIALLSGNDSMIQATIKQNGEIAKEALGIKVVDAKTYEMAGERMKFLVEVRDRSTNFLDPIREMLLRPYQLAQSRLKEAVTPIDTARSYLSTQRAAWYQTRETARLAEEARLRREQEERAERERKAAGEQLTITAMEEALASGDEAKAEALLNNPISVPGQYIPPVHVESDVPKTEGVSRRENWKGRVTDIEALILDVAEGILDFKTNGNRGAHAPVTVLEPNNTAINQLCKAQKKATSYPGIEAYNDATEAVRRKK